MTFLSGPFNIQQNNSAAFAVEFFDSLGSLSVPSSANMTVTYINNSGASQTDSVVMSVTGSFFTGTWSSTSAALGMATWVATASPSSIQLATGQLRVIQRRGSS